MGKTTKGSFPDDGNYTPPDVKLSSAETKRRVIDMVEKGWAVPAIMSALRKSEETYYYYLKTDPEFKSRIDLIRAGNRAGCIRVWCLNQGYLIMCWRICRPSMLKA